MCEDYRPEGWPADDRYEIGTKPPSLEEKLDAAERNARAAGIDFDREEERAVLLGMKRTPYAAVDGCAFNDEEQATEHSNHVRENDLLRLPKEEADDAFIALDDLFRERMANRPHVGGFTEIWKETERELAEQEPVVPTFREQLRGVMREVLLDVVREVMEEAFATKD